MLQHILKFLGNPIYEEDENQNFGYRLIILLKLVVWSLVLSFTLLTVVMGLENVFEMDLGQHASEELFEKFPVVAIVFLIVIVAPVIEELLFRGPLILFRKKTTFKYAFYISVMLFGGIHLANFSNFSQHLWIAPLLVSPQLGLGIFAGYIRVRFGLKWAMALHATYNLILSIPVLLADLLNLSIT
ncbi:CPBP family intramembrane metalloprotease [Maribacter sp.]|nr:CPBP family intramembrane metalloprotease [Maribacter sp.]